MSKDFHSLTVKDIRRETADALTLVFSVPENLKPAFAYTQGQYLTLRFTIKGQEVRRAYSMCSSPLDADLAVTIKKVKNGLVSTYIHDQVQVGQQIEVMPPEGRFFTALDADQRKTYYLIGAGSGITPLMSILRTVLEAEPKSIVHLLYGNRNEDSIIFKDQLDQLEKRYDGQLTIDHVLSQPRREKPKGLSGLFSKGTTLWEGQTGRIHAQQVNRFLKSYPKRTKETEYFVCGPGSMIDDVIAALQEQGVDKKHIHSERFLSHLPENVPHAQGVAGATVQVRLNGQDLSVVVPANKTILDALVERKHNPPYSCTSGACSTCMAKLLSGTVKMDACYALDEEEVEAGYILTCQSHPTTAEVAITYDV